jgi:predicted RNA-binding Zn ribbon-like protein
VVASTVVDGLVVPISIGGHPALDFCNTRAGRRAPRPKEYLITHAHLVVWAAHNGLVPHPAVAGLRRAGRADPAGAQRVLTRAVRLREAVHAVLTATATPQDWRRVNAEVRRAGAAAVLTPGRPATWSLATEVSRSSNVELPLLAVALAAAGLLTSAAATHVSACPGEICGWLFADPRGRRRWCSMAWCGNRAKARRYAQRHRRSGSEDPCPQQHEA